MTELENVAEEKKTKADVILSSNRIWIQYFLTLKFKRKSESSNTAIEIALESISQAVIHGAA